MNFEEFLAQVQRVRKLSEVKRNMLKALWGNDDDTFPKNWVLGKTLLQIADYQSDYGKRLRELRDHNRLDITSSHYNGAPAHRLESATIGEEQPREYLTKLEKNKLFEQYGFACQGCGKVIPFNKKGLQADHRIPLSRGGTNDFSNWQPLCVLCNVGKRRACQGCKDDCHQCAWAFPEVTGSKVVISLPLTTMKLLESGGYNNQKDIEKIISISLHSFLSKD